MIGGTSVNFKPGTCLSTLSAGVNVLVVEDALLMPIAGCAIQPAILPGSLLALSAGDINPRLRQRSGTHNTVSISPTSEWRTMSASANRTTAMSAIGSSRRAISASPESPSRRSL